MPIEATSPTVVAATYGLWAIESFAIQGDGLVRIGQTDPPAPISARATLVKYRVREDGLAERSPLVSDRVDISIPDLYEMAGSDPNTAAALASLLTAFSAYGFGQGLL